MEWDEPAIIERRIEAWGVVSGGEHVDEQQRGGGGGHAIRGWKQ